MLWHCSFWKSASAVEGEAIVMRGEEMHGLGWCGSMQQRCNRRIDGRRDDRRGSGKGLRKTLQRQGGYAVVGRAEIGSGNGSKRDLRGRQLEAAPDGVSRHCEQFRAGWRAIKSRSTAEAAQKQPPEACRSSRQERSAVAKLCYSYAQVVSPDKECSVPDSVW
jgi:hypothetical protein